MKIAAVTAAMAAIVAAGSLASPSFAQDYGAYGYGYGDGSRNPCQQAQHDNGTGGGILGALAGAVIGSNIAHHGGRTGGAVIGALAGAAIGDNIGRASAKSSEVCAGADYGRYDQGYYVQPTYYGGYGYESRDYGYRPVVYHRYYERDYREHRYYGDRDD